MDGFDMKRQFLVLTLSFAGWSVFPGIISTPGHVQSLTHPVYRKPSLALLDKIVAHLWCRLKTAKAFF
jgi:hypothetical protein